VIEALTVRAIVMSLLLLSVDLNSSMSLTWRARQDGADGTDAAHAERLARIFGLEDLVAHWFN
jgi:hypothetical protein